jgi:hypothetical protein
MNARIAIWLAVGSCLLVIISRGFGAEIKPLERQRPLFRIFATNPAKGDGAQRGISFDDKHPLLVIWAVGDLRLGPDRKAVLVILTNDDARKFSKLTRKYNQGVLVLEGDGRVLEVMQVTAPVDNGTLEFKYPDDAAVAEYVRKRFRMAEFR